MENETIIIKIEAHIYGNDQMHDYRSLTVESTRGNVAKKLDEFCADIEASFEH